MRDPLRIAICAPVSLQQLAPIVDQHHFSTDGMGSTLVASLVAETHRRGHTLHVITLSPDDRDVGIHTGDRLVIDVRRCRPRAHHRAMDAFRHEREAVAEALTQSRCDLAHAHWSYEFSLPAAASGMPTLSTLHDWAPAILRQHTTPYRAVRLAMQARLLRSGTPLTGVSPYIVDRAARWSKGAVTLVPNGLQFGENLPARTGDQQFHTLGALNVGFTRRKNVAALLEAFALVGAELQHCRLRLAGPGYEPHGAAHRWAKEHSLDNDVEFLGPLEPNDVPAFLRSLDLFVHPSLEESFGMVLIEAMREGTPVLGGSDSGGVPWVLDDGRSGCLTDVTRPTVIADSCLELLTRPADREALGLTGYRSAKARFALPKVVDEYEAVYRLLLEHN